MAHERITELDRIKYGLDQLKGVHARRLTGGRDAADGLDGVYRGVCSDLQTQLELDEPTAQMVGSALNLIAIRAAKKEHTHEANRFGKEFLSNSGGGRAI